MKRNVQNARGQILVISDTITGYLCQCLKCSLPRMHTEHALADNSSCLSKCSLLVPKRQDGDSQKATVHMSDLSP